MTAIELADATVFLAEGAETAARVLREELAARTGRTPDLLRERPSDGPTIAVGTGDALGADGALADLADPGPEGYRLLARDDATVLVAGADDRGTLYGVGKLLRLLEWGEGTARLPADVAISATPDSELRGHQLGYRPKTNAYDAWDEAQFDQYVRELALFGANSIEILPPRTDDHYTSRHVETPPFEMMERLSGIVDGYGLDVWMWYPNMGEDYTDPEIVERELAEREAIFAKVPRLDSVFIPGGDPGDLDPATLFEWAADVEECLTEHHPDADLWLSPQSFHGREEWLSGFYDGVRDEPGWLGGIVFGPWVKTSLPELREIVPDRYPIRRYPDITHSLACQYPVRDWDPALAATLGRECINPRPRDQAAIHDALREYAIGSIGYSEGINDDVNKFVWLDREWDHGVDPRETLTEYARLFVDSEHAGALARGFAALEGNFRGRLATNDGVDVTLRQWQDLESSLPEEIVAGNYRFQMGLLRAYVDAYVRRRLRHETAIEDRAIEALEGARENDALAAVDAAEAHLDERGAVGGALRERAWELADRLFETIGAQFSVERHGAKSWVRAGFMDDLDVPLNDEPWLRERFAEIRALDDEEARLDAIDDLVTRTSPGAGGYYEDFETVADSRIRGDEWASDPGSLASPLVDFAPPFLHHESEDLEPVPFTCTTAAGTHYDTPLSVRFDDVDPESPYRLRVRYTTATLIGRYGPFDVRLEANGTVLYDGLSIEDPLQTEAVDVPAGTATPDGELTLTWTTPDGQKGPKVAELWLERLV